MALIALLAAGTIILPAPKKKRTKLQRKKFTTNQIAASSKSTKKVKTEDVQPVNNEQVANQNAGWDPAWGPITDSKAGYGEQVVELLHTNRRQIQPTSLLSPSLTEETGNILDQLQLVAGESMQGDLDILRDHYISQLQSRDFTTMTDDEKRR